MLNRINHRFAIVFLFLLIGLIWSGGNGWWLAALGVFVLIGLVGDGAAKRVK